MRGVVGGVINACREAAGFSTESAGLWDTSAARTAESRRRLID